MSLTECHTITKQARYVATTMAEGRAYCATAVHEQCPAAVASALGKPGWAKFPCQVNNAISSG